MKHIPRLYLRGAPTGAPTEEDEIAFEEHLLECATTCRHEVATAALFDKSCLMPPHRVEEVKIVLQRAIRPEPVEQATEAVDPIKALINRFRDEVIPRIEQQRDPSQRKAMLARLEEDIRGAFKVLDDLDNDLQETRRRCTELFKAARKLRPRGKSRPRSRKLKLGRPHLIPTDEQKEVVLDAIRKRGSLAMGELCHATGYGLAKLKRTLKTLREEGIVERSGATSGTRYRA